jgi:hypothetical protein
VEPGSIVEVVGRLHHAYHFRPETYRFVGIGEEVLRSAGVLEDATPKRGPASRERGAREGIGKGKASGRTRGR